MQTGLTASRAGRAVRAGALEALRHNVGRNQWVDEAHSARLIAFTHSVEQHRPSRSRKNLRRVRGGLGPMIFRSVTEQSGPTHVQLAQEMQTLLAPGAAREDLRLLEEYARRALSLCGLLPAVTKQTTALAQAG